MLYGKSLQKSCFWRLLAGIIKGPAGQALGLGEGLGVHSYVSHGVHYWHPSYIHSYHYPTETELKSPNQTNTLAHVR